jgi:hypothetical protein
MTHPTKKVPGGPKVGRPGNYDRERHPHLAHRLALLGASVQEIAEALRIPIGTFERWKLAAVKRHKETKPQHRHLLGNKRAAGNKSGNQGQPSKYNKKIATKILQAMTHSVAFVGCRECP